MSSSTTPAMSKYCIPGSIFLSAANCRIFSSVVTVLLLPSWFGFGSVFNEKPRSRFLLGAVFSQETQSIVAKVRVARLHPQRRQIYVLCDNRRSIISRFFFQKSFNRPITMYLIELIK